MKTVTLGETSQYPIFTIDDEPLPSDRTTEISDELLKEYKTIMEAFDAVQEKIRNILELGSV